MQQENLKISLDFEYFFVSYNGEFETNPILNVFNIKLKSNKAETNFKNYLVIQGIGQDKIVFQSIESKKIGEDFVIEFSDLRTRDIGFATTKNLEFDELELVISPLFSELSVINPDLIGPCNYNRICEPHLNETWRNCRHDCHPWKRTIFFWFLVLIGAIVAYIMISQWYRVNYESHLFKNRNDVFNLIQFMHSATSRGLSKKEINEKLLSYGWNNEQIGYAFRKIEGKNIVPFDISVLFNKKKLKVNAASTIPGIRFKKRENKIIKQDKDDRINFN